MVKNIFIICIVFLISEIIIYGQDRNIPFEKILENIAAYKNKKIELRLKLKNVDRTFEKIVFYDSDNIDIEFDISDRMLKKRLKYTLQNVHEGMDYFVEFIVLGSSSGILRGELRGFTPAVLEKIPGMTK